MRLRLKPTKKQSRQDMILKLVKERPVSTQEDLQKELKKFGFYTTQSSLSRDVTELSLVKQKGSYVVPPRQKNINQPVVTSIESAGQNLIVVKTIIGMAAPVGLTIDEKKIPYIIGTIAGDDTVFIATPRASAHETIKKQIKNLFKGG